MKPELALQHTKRLAHTQAFQDAVNQSIWGTGGGAWAEPTPIPNVGQFNTPGYLPTNSSPPDPAITAGNYQPPGSNPLDFWTRIDPNMGYVDPSITINPADYPSPGDGASLPEQPSILSRLFNNIPAVRLGKILGKAFQPRNTPWQQNAAPRIGSNTQVMPPIPPGGALFGFRPSQGGGTPHYDFTSGRTVPTVSLNPLYNTGSGFQPVANAGTDIRWAPNSGTVNYTASQTTKNFIAGGGYKGNPNRQVAPDSGMDTFSTGGNFAGQIDPETGLLTHVANHSIGPAFQSVQGGPTLRADPASADAYNTWLTQNANVGSGGLEPFGWMNVPPPGTISGPPRLPGFLGGA